MHGSHGTRGRSLEERTQCAGGPARRCDLKRDRMARWPDNIRATLLTALLIFVLFPLLCFLAWWFVTSP